MSEGEQQREQEPASREQEPKDSPKVWIASLSDYNAGHLHGAWVEADQEPDDIWAGINEVLRSSKEPGAEEWAVFDYEGFGPLRLSEYETVERISRLGRGIGEHGEAFAAFANFLGGEDELLDQFEDCYSGQWESAVDCVEEFLEDAGIDRILDDAVPGYLRDYVRVDTEALARDMEFEGSLLSVETEGGVFLFHPP
ncbi:MAG: antirestriction protein ArdA [Acidimicrobiales bacterium]